MKSYKVTVNDKKIYRIKAECVEDAITKVKDSKYVLKSPPGKGYGFNKENCYLKPSVIPYIDDNSSSLFHGDIKNTKFFNSKSEALQFLKNLYNNDAFSPDDTWNTVLNSVEIEEI